MYEPNILIVATSGEDKSKPYVTAIRHHGGNPILVQPGENHRRFPIHGVLLTGGGDLNEKFYNHKIDEKERATLGKIEPAREQYEIQLLEWARTRNLPVLGICRGFQMMNSFARGTLIPDIPTWQKKIKVKPLLKHRGNLNYSEPAHEIHFDGDSQFFRIMGSRRTLGVNSIHHQGISECGSALKITARSSDGMIEAFEDPSKRFWLGVQFHPERMWKKHPIFSNLFYRFKELARQMAR
jgi:putative glutamine amidotransferase